MPATFFTRGLFPLFLLLLLGACSPRYDWRDSPAPDGSFAVLMPAKPTTATRPVNLNGRQYPMTMTAAEVGHVTFAVGSIRVAEASMAAATMLAMKTALLQNIGASGAQEKTTASALDRNITLEVTAIGKPVAASQGQPMAVFARFVARDMTLYQALVAGPQNEVTSESVETFLTSLKVK